jgi:hypothetical protein
MGGGRRRNALDHLFRRERLAQGAKTAERTMSSWCTARGRHGSSWSEVIVRLHAAGLHVTAIVSEVGTAQKA